MVDKIESIARRALGKYKFLRANFWTEDPMAFVQIICSVPMHLEHTF